MAPAHIEESPLSPPAAPVAAPRLQPVAVPQAPLLPAPASAPALSVLDSLPADLLRVGDARWFTGRPDTFEPPLAFYGRVEGRAPGYYELATDRLGAPGQLTEADLLRVLAVTDDILALQLPAHGITPAVLQLLQDKTAKLECLQLSGQACAGACVKPLLEAVAPRLRAFSLGGSGSDEFARLPGSVEHGLECLEAMQALEYLDVSGLGLTGHVPLERLHAALEGKQLRGLSVAGCTGLDIASLLDCAALASLEYLDARGTAVKRSLRHWHASDRLMSRLESNGQWRCLLLPGAFVPRQPERLQALQDSAGLRYLHCHHTLVNQYGGAEDAGLMHGGAGCEESQPGACEQFLRDCADLDANLANLGRWMPIPRDRWDALAVRKKGAVYVLTELQALRGQGFDVRLREVMLRPTRNAYGESCYALTFTDSLRNRVSVTLMESELDDAIRHRFVSRLAQHRGALSSVEITGPHFRELRKAAQSGDASLRQALNTLPM